MSHRYLYVQKLDAAGAPLCGPVARGGLRRRLAGRWATSRLRHRRCRGAVLSWYQAATYLQSYAQHVAADGSEVFPMRHPAVHQPGAAAGRPRRRLDRHREISPSGRRRTWGEPARRLRQKLTPAGAAWSRDGTPGRAGGRDHLSWTVRTLPVADGAYVFVPRGHRRQCHPRPGRSPRRRRQLRLHAAGGGDRHRGGGQEQPAAVLALADMALLVWADTRSVGATSTPELSTRLHPGSSSASIVLYRGVVANLGRLEALALPLASGNDRTRRALPAHHRPGADTDDDVGRDRTAGHLPRAPSGSPPARTWQHPARRQDADRRRCLAVKARASASLLHDFLAHRTKDGQQFVLLPGATWKWSSAATRSSTRASKAASVMRAPRGRSSFVLPPVAAGAAGGLADLVHELLLEVTEIVVAKNLLMRPSAATRPTKSSTTALSAFFSPSAGRGWPPPTPGDWRNGERSRPGWRRRGRATATQAGIDLPSPRVSFRDRPDLTRQPPGRSHILVSSPGRAISRRRDRSPALRRIQPPLPANSLASPWRWL